MDQRDTSRRTRSRRVRGALLHAAPAREHRLRLSGALGHDTAVELEAAIDDLCAAGVELLTLDLSDLHTIDRTGIGVIAMRCRLCARRGVAVELTGARSGVAEAIAAAGLGDRLPIRENPLAQGAR